MELADAIKLIDNGVKKKPGSQVWADLGAGTGLFTIALATQLGAGSTIYAIDRDASALDRIQSSSKQITVHKIRGDFIHEDLGLNSLDGILMANALHFVPDRLTFIERLKKRVKPSGRFIIVEYERKTGNTWVPYPITFGSLQDLAQETGFTSITKLAEQPSIYNQGNMYSALLEF